MKIYTSENKFYCRCSKDWDGDGAPTYPKEGQPMKCSGTMVRKLHPIHGEVIGYITVCNSCGNESGGVNNAGNSCDLRVCRRCRGKL